MLAFSTTPVFSNSNTEWLSAEEPFSLNYNNNNYFYKDNVSSLEYLFPVHQPPQPPQVEVVKRSTTPPSPNTTMVRKLNHNASERNRRNKINTMITSLRSLLPPGDPTVEGLTKKKEELLSSLRTSWQGDAVNIGSKRKVSPHDNSDFIVSTSWLNDSEAAVHISSYKAHKTPLPEILLCLENNGHFLLNASSSETFEGRVFYHLHFQVEKAQRLESGILTEKLLSMYGKKQRIF